ncbi:hypothetical protein [Paenibacillus sp. DMB20]|uniref:hypothetical protein n=1 Tax=Paenibacillus sp. DMB20 TaxID=1642570 RepID=UPI000627BF2C|nr:hypothetical protein [Paenibacillus sp. DMB20]KKO52492.1 hypothetical protein XI25_20225 [Paenibacillus sp. DMB20]
MLKRKGNSSRTLNYLTILGIIALLLVSRLPHAEAADSGWDAALSSIDKLHDSFTALDMANKEMREQTRCFAS